MIRELEPSDIAEVMQLAKAMHAESPFYSRYPFSEQKVERLCEVFLENPDWLCVVAEFNEKMIGFLAVTIVPTFFGDARFVEDISFYVTPKYRGTSAALRLIRTVEAWAIANNVEAIRVGVTTGTNPGPTGNFFLRLGYEESGRLYTKLVGINN
jgi:GNAT superfamily N-acetyltransferase